MSNQRKCAAWLLLAILAAALAAQSALAAGVTYMPDVTAEMSAASYWADRQPGSREAILTPEEIAAFNRDTSARPETMVMDLRGEAATFDGLKRNEDIRASATDDAEYYLGKTYDGDGREADWAYFEAMIENSIDPAATANMPLRYGIAVVRTLLRVFPSPEPLLDDPNDPDFDYQALSGVRVNEPMLIYTTSADGKYLSVRISSCSGWVPVEDVAICASREEWLSAWDFPQDRLLVVYGNKEYTDASNSHPETARRMLTIGTALELVTDLKPGTLVGNRSPYHNYVVYLPVRRDDGSYEKRMALIPETARVSAGYLPLTMENVATVALGCLGDAYGWGGMLDVDDCSGMIHTIYACFGLKIGRNGNWQAEMNVEKIDMHYMPLEEKRLMLDELPLGAALCFDGHEMLYLGKVNGKYYVVSTVSSIVSPDTGKILRTRNVMINTLDVKRGSGKTWLGAINMAFMPCYARLPGKHYDFPEMLRYHDDAAYCLESGVMAALDIDGSFGIGMEATRGELAYALWKLAGAPGSEPEATPEPAPELSPRPTPTATAIPAPTPVPPYPFGDVTEDDPSRIAIAWVAEAGLMAGAREGAFEPDGAVRGGEVIAALEELARMQEIPMDADTLGGVEGDAPLKREELAKLLHAYGRRLDALSAPAQDAQADGQEAA